MTYYWLKEEIHEFMSNKYFPDSILATFALLSIVIAFPFYPVELIAVFAVIVFLLTRYHPLAGLMVLLFVSLPVYLFQAPLIALLYCIFLVASLVFGYKHYRIITLAYALIALPFSFLGFFLEIPALVIGILYIGLKRGAIATAFAVVMLPMLATMMALPIAAPIAFNALGFKAVVGTSSVSAFITALKPAPSITQLPGAFGTSVVNFLTLNIAGSLEYVIYLCILSIAYNITAIGVQLAVWLIVVFAIAQRVMSSRSGFKGTVASLFSFAILATYIGLAYFFNSAISPYMLAGFLITPLVLVLLELNDIDIVRALDVMKQDFMGKFGEAFEDLTSGSRETLDDIGNYEHTKEELREAILQPIEHKEIEGAYNIKPAKGILLFGPPGTGKTMLMRALSNEIRARFLYVKASTILSAQEGESAKTLSKIFDVAKAHTPTLLFFDEVESLARRRDASADDLQRQMLSTLLAEMDGFQKMEGVVVVGATNTPQLIDPAFMRPGRVDRVIYMPLPDDAGRVAIFKHYSKLYPMSDDIDFDKLSRMTKRFSGADIANICREAATRVGNEAVKQSKAMRIDTDHLVEMIKQTKPTTTYEQLEEYDAFKLDYERRLNGEPVQKPDEAVKIEDVVNMADAKRALNEAITIPLAHPEMMKEYDVKNISGILLFGPPGCGKTMLMRGIANATEGLTMISVSGADLSKEGYENAVRKLKENFFRAKENIPSILFIDEIDSLVPNRDTASEGMVQLTAEFLREFDQAKEAGGLVIVGATNRPDAIEPALIRPGRLDKLVYASPPDKEARVTLFKINLKNAPVAADLDYDKLAAVTTGYTGADIANICREAKMHALEDSLIGHEADKVPEEGTKMITTADINAIIKNTRPTATPAIIGRYLAFMAEHGRE